jgi:hypothetical protein
VQANRDGRPKRLISVPPESLTAIAFQNRAVRHRIAHSPIRAVTQGTVSPGSA